jgi:uncharacterized protein YcfL
MKLIALPIILITLLAGCKQAQEQDRFHKHQVVYEKISG